MLIDARNLSLDVPDMSHQVLIGKCRSLRILKNVSLAIDRGETVGIAGESGSGKTSLGRTLLRLQGPSEGQLLFDGTDITHMPRRLANNRNKFAFVIQLL